MLLPLSALGIGCLVFGAIGAILLKNLSSYDLTITNLVFYIVGAFIGAVIIAALYGWVAAGDDNQLKSTVAVIGMIISVFFGGVLSGLLSVFIKKMLQFAMFSNPYDD